MVPEPTRRAGPSRRLLVAAALTTVVAVVALVLTRPDGGGGGGDADNRDLASSYTVREGDTLTSVAVLHGMEVDALLEELGLTLADSVAPGSVIDIPALPTDPAGWPPPLTRDVVRAQQAGFFDRWAEEYDVPTALLQSLAWELSRWDNQDVDGDGRVGIGHIDPEQLAWINEELIPGDDLVDPRDPESNVRLTAAHLGHLLEASGGDHAAAVAAYQQGLTEPDDAGWDLNLRRFVRRVLLGAAAFEAPPPPTATTTTTTPEG